MIRTTVDDDLRVVTIDRPERRNAITPEGLDELQAALQDATEPVVYLTGAGSAFCAGADLDVVAELDAESAGGFAKRGQDAARAIEEYDGIVVAGIDGPARGGGLEFALACDLRVCTPDATMAESGVSHGLFGAWGGTARLPRIVGEGDAMDISVSARVLDAETALRMGLVSRIVDEPRDVAEELIENDERAMRAIKRRVRDRSSLADQEAKEAEVFADLIDER